MIIEQKIEPLPQRLEVRYLLEEGSVSKTQELLQMSGFFLEDHENPITQTVYFSSRSLEIVSGGYIRIRRYVPEDQVFRDTIDLFPGDEWFLEVKLQTGEKERIQKSYGTVEDLLSPINRQTLAEQFPAGAMFLRSFDDRLVPIVATQWFREHFSSNQYRSRITLDSKMSYYGFLPGQSRGILMSNRSGFKLEIKTPVDFESELPAIQKALGIFQIEPLVGNWHEDLLRKLYSEFLSRKQEYAS